jgi:transcription elongation factor GreA
MSITSRPTQLITRQGHERLSAELDRLVRLQRPRMADELRDARADGGEPGENAGLTEMLQDQAAVERRIDDLRALLGNVTIAEPPADGTAGLGQQVRIRLAPGAPPRTYLLVSALEVDASRGEISIESPIGQALLGRRAGDVVEAQTPGGLRRVELIAVG